jgi:cytochrome c oxidase assembly factor CtaG/putative copper export protein
VTPAGAVGRWLAAAALVAFSVLVVVLLAGGGAPRPAPAGLPDAGPVTGWGLPAAGLVAMTAAVATVGLLLSAAFLLPSPGGRLAEVPRRGVRLAAVTAAVWLAAVVVQAVLTLSDILGQPPPDVLDPNLLRSFLGQTSQGRALLVQAGLVVVVIGFARSVRTPGAAVAALLVALAGLVPPMLTGHSASAGSHALAVSSLLVHVLAAALWVGGLAALGWAAVAGRPGLQLAVPRFSTLAAWCFAAVAVSGVVNAAVRLGAVRPLFTSAYGGLVLAKVGALVVLAGFGWVHRRRTVARVAAAPVADTGRGYATRLFLTVAAAELVVMAATVALAVGLSRTPTPVGPTRDTSPAAELLGFPLPPAPTPGRLLLGWAPDGFALAFVVLAGALYAAGVLRLRRRGDRWPVHRTVLWFTGLALFAWATSGGLGLYSHVLFSAHMIAHMVLSMVAPIPLVLAAPVTLALRALPGPRVPGEVGPRQLLSAALRSRPVRLVSHPLVALALFVGSLYGLYFTALFPWLMRNHLGHVAMEFHFLAVGSLFFWVLVGIDPTPRRIPPLARMGLLFAAMPFHAFFSVAVMSAGTALAAGYYAALHRTYARDLVADQHLGGGIAWALGELPVVVVLAAVCVQWIRADQREAVRLDRAADRAASRAASRARGRADGTGAAADGTGDPGAGRTAGGREVDELAEYNAYLAALAARDARQAQAAQQPRRAPPPRPRREHAEGDHR